MAKYTPLNREELEAKNDFEPLAPGRYDFQVHKATEKTSSSGNDMIELILDVYAGDRTYKVWDYLTFTVKSQYKPWNFCKAVGLEKDFETGELTAFQCEGRSGEVNIAIQKAGVGKDGKDHPEKNIVRAYIEIDLPEPLPPQSPKSKPETNNPKQSGRPVPDEDDSNIPF